MPNTKNKLLFGAVNLFAKNYRYLLQNTCTYHLPEKLTAALKSKEPVIIAILHQDAFTSYAYLTKYASGKGSSGRRFCSLASLSKDGGLATYLMEQMGIKTIRGSSSREGLRSFLEMGRMVNDEGYSVIFPCDGPRRPYGIVKPGAVMLASLTGVPIYLVRTRAKHHIVLESTPPKVFLPRPFSEITVLEIGPIQVKRRSTKDVIEKYRTELQRGFDKLILQADDYFKS